MTQLERAKDIIEAHNNKLPLIVAEYFCFLYGEKILCNSKLNYKVLFKPFIHFRNYTYYHFDVVESVKEDYFYFKLTEIEVLCPEYDEEYFTDSFNNMVYNQYNTSHVDWLDTEEQYKDKKTKKKIVGKAKIIL